MADELKPTEITPIPEGSILGDVTTAVAPELGFLKYWKAILFGLLLLAFGTTTLVEQVRIKSRDATIATMTANEAVVSQQVQSLQNSIATYKADIVSSNQKLEDAANKSADIQKQFDDFKTNFGKKLIDAYKKAADIQKEQAPKTCADITKYLQDHLGDK
jgi:septal ring factor EnvC (AmiA/AmiB activator)